MEGFDQIVRDEHARVPGENAQTEIAFPGEDLRGIRSRDQEVEEGIPSDYEHDREAVDDTDETGWKKTLWEDVKVGDFIKVGVFFFLQVLRGIRSPDVFIDGRFTTTKVSLPVSWFFSHVFLGPESVTR